MTALQHDVGQQAAGAGRCALAACTRTPYSVLAYADR